MKERQLPSKQLTFRHVGRVKLPRMQYSRHLPLVLATAVACLVHQCAAQQESVNKRAFEIKDNTFVKDGCTLQIISGRYTTHNFCQN